MASLAISTKHLKNNEHQFFKNFSKYERGGNTFELMSQGQCYPDTKTSQRHHQKITDQNFYE